MHPVGREPLHSKLVGHERTLLNDQDSGILKTGPSSKKGTAFPDSASFDSTISSDTPTIGSH
jgi:hypothetical protein